MYKSKHVTGLIPIGEFIRMQEGSVLIYTVNDGIEYQAVQNVIQSSVLRASAKVQQHKLLLVDPATAKTVQCVEVTVLTSGKPKERKKTKA